MHFARAICQPETALSSVIPPIKTLFRPEGDSARYPDKYEGPVSRHAKTKSGCGNDLRVLLDVPTVQEEPDRRLSQQHGLVNSAACVNFTGITAPALRILGGSLTR